LHGVMPVHAASQAMPETPLIGGHIASGVSSVLAIQSGRGNDVLHHRDTTVSEQGTDIS
jgi:hypothetical protein